MSVLDLWRNPTQLVRLGTENRKMFLSLILFLPLFKQNHGKVNISIKCFHRIKNTLLKLFIKTKFHKIIQEHFLFSFRKDKFLATSEVHWVAQRQGSKLVVFLFFRRQSELCFQQMTPFQRKRSKLKGKNGRLFMFGITLYLCSVIGFFSQTEYLTDPTPDFRVYLFLCAYH